MTGEPTYFTSGLIQNRWKKISPPEVREKNTINIGLPSARRSVPTDEGLVRRPAPRSHAATLSHSVGPSPSPSPQTTLDDRSPRRRSRWRPQASARAWSAARVRRAGDVWDRRWAGFRSDGASEDGLVEPGIDNGELPLCQGAGLTKAAPRAWAVMAAGAWFLWPRCPSFGGVQ